MTNRGCLVIMNMEIYLIVMETSSSSDKKAPLSSLSILFLFSGRQVKLAAAFVVTITLLCTFPASVYAEDPIEGYIPPPEKEAPIFNASDQEAARPLKIAAGSACALGLAAGITVSIFGVTQIANSIERGFFSDKMQNGIYLSGSGVLISSIAAVIFEWAVPFKKDSPRRGPFAE